MTLKQPESQTYDMLYIIYIYIPHTQVISSSQVHFRLENHNLLEYLKSSVISGVCLPPVILHVRLVPRGGLFKPDSNGTNEAKGRSKVASIAMELRRKSKLVNIRAHGLRVEHPGGRLLPELFEKGWCFSEWGGTNSSSEPVSLTTT